MQPVEQRLESFGGDGPIEIDALHRHVGEARTPWPVGELMQGTAAVNRRAAEERDVPPVLAEHRLAAPQVKAAADRQVERRVLQQPDLGVGTEELDVFVQPDLALDVEPVVDAVSTPQHDPEVVVRAALAEDDQRVGHQLEVAAVDGFGRFHDAEILGRGGGRDEKSEREQRGKTSKKHADLLERDTTPSQTLRGGH